MVLPFKVSDEVATQCSATETVLRCTAASVAVQQCKLLRTKISLSRCERNFKYQVGSRQNNERKRGWKRVHRVNF